MLRLTRQSDYAIVLMTHFAAIPDKTVQNARDLAASANLPLPTVSKILKALARASLLVSHRGVKGGYSLARKPEGITVAEIIEALEGPIALMECTAGPGHCEKEPHCQVREPWVRINRAIHQTLERVTLDELVGAGHGELPLLEIQKLPTRDAASEPTSR